MKSRMGYLDALRGFAALSVLLQHTFEKIWQVGSDGLLRQALSFSLFHFVNFGRFGVILFFMTSGFVIPFSFKGNRPIFNFTVSRLFRLYPAYWFSIATVALTSWIIAGKIFSPVQIIANITMIQRVLFQKNISDVYWTLFLELIFYFICAILFYRNLLMRWSVSAGFAFALIAMATIVSTIKYGLHCRIPYLDDPIYLSYMFTGAVFRVAFLDGDRKAARTAYGLVATHIVAALFNSGILFHIPSNGNVYLSPVPLFSAYALALAVFVFCTKFKSPNSKPLKYMGTISYSLYLNQATALALLYYLMPPAGASLEGLAFIASVVALATAASALTYHYIEQPFINLGRKMIK